MSNNAWGSSNEVPSKSRVRLRVRRLLALAVMAAMVYGLYFLVFRTTLAAPVLAHAGPVRDGVEWIIADPSRAWIALTVLAIPHLGLYMLLFGDNR